MTFKAYIMKLNIEDRSIYQQENEMNIYQQDFLHYTGILEESHPAAYRIMAPKDNPEGCKADYDKLVEKVCQELECCIDINEFWCKI